MRMSRRQILSAMAMAPLAAMTRAAKATDKAYVPTDDRGMVIHPKTALSGVGGHYAHLADVGPYGMPQPVRIEPLVGLRMLVYIPPQAPAAGVVIFSHGEMATPQTYSPLLSHWASHGFAVFAPIHDDGATTVHSDITAMFADLGIWRRRARSCRGALDIVGDIEHTTGVRMARGNAIIAGHSGGSLVAQILMGTRLADGKGGAFDEPDPRFAGGLLLSPHGRGALGLTDGSWDAVTRPMMVVTGNGDADPTGQSPNTKLEPYALSPDGNKHLAWFKTIAPSTFSGQGVDIGIANARTQTFQDLLATTTAFLFACGNKDADTMADLAGGYYTRATQGRVTMYAK